MEASQPNPVEKRQKQRLRVAAYAARNPEKVKEQSKRSKAKQRAANPEKFAQRNKNWRIKNADKLRWYEVSRKFGISQAEYSDLYESQNGVCAICRNPETATRNGVVRALAVDHCHSSGRIRGLLCSNCNTGIGKLKDDPNVIRRAAEYLDKKDREDISRSCL
jgi:hypothetical protein